MRQAAETCRQAAAQNPTVLRASRAGVVSRVLRQAGDVVTARFAGVGEAQVQL